MAEEIEVEKCYLWKLRKSVTLTLDQGQGHISMRNTYTTTSMPDHVT